VTLADDIIDELLIQRVLAEYCHRFDDGRFDDQAHLYRREATSMSPPD
jgi:hypothetical protein